MIMQNGSDVITSQASQARIFTGKVIKRHLMTSIMTVRVVLSVHRLQFILVTLLGELLSIFKALLFQMQFFELSCLGCVLMELFQMLRNAEPSAARLKSDQRGRGLI